MGISGEIEVATIELPFQASLTTSVVCIDDQEICQKVCCTSFQSFCSAYLTCCFFFLDSVVVVVALSSLVALPHKLILDMRRFRLKNRHLMENERRSRRPQVHVPIERLIVHTSWYLLFILFYFSFIS